MSTQTSCDFCEKSFSKRDDYVKGSINISYTDYTDQESEICDTNEDACNSCLTKIMKALENLRRRKQ